jgi:predicted DsbA family dithiol-disulfide isomerase
MKPTLDAAVYFDLICPWCFIGKRSLDAARQLLANSDPKVTLRTAWRSVQLIPQTPREGLDFTEFYERRLGGAEAVRRRQGEVRQAAAPYGIEINYQRISRFPNSGLAHRLVSHMRRDGTEALLEALFAAYFIDGRDIGDQYTLLDVAEPHVERSKAAEWLASYDGTPYADRRHPASGVPLFVFNDRVAVSGAQPPNVLHRAMQQALA